MIDNAMLKLNNASSINAGSGNIIMDNSNTIISGAATVRLPSMLVQAGNLKPFMMQIPLHRSMYKVLVANCADLTHLAQAVLLAHQDGNHLLC